MIQLGCKASDNFETTCTDGHLNHMISLADSPLRDFMQAAMITLAALYYDCTKQCVTLIFYQVTKIQGGNSNTKENRWSVMSFKQER